MAASHPKVRRVGRSMTETLKIRASLGWFIAGLLLTTGLVNLCGFLSPFYSHLTGAESRALLSFGQLVTPWFGVCFAIAFWLLSDSVRSVLSVWGLRLLGVGLAVSYALPGLLNEGPPRAVAEFAHGVLQFLALLVAVVAVRAVVARSSPTMR